MAQTLLHLWQRPRTAAVDCTIPPETHVSAAAAGGGGNRSGSLTQQSVSSCCCGCLAKLMRRLKKQGKMIRAAAVGPSRQPSLECRYDALSYSLNFDQCLVEDEDYLQFCAFSSRFVANGKGSDCQSPQQLVGAVGSATAAAS
ncbi:hypothetical protein LINPERPRIM_LOCUS19757 [Linum perenne]